MAQARFPILFITSSRVGDAVLTSGLLKRLVDEAPHAAFTIAAGALTAPLFRDTPGLEALVPFERKRFAGHWFELWAAARKRRWGLVLDMRGSALARFLRARRRAVKKPLPPALAPLHKVLEAARVLRLEDDPPSPYLFTSPETEARADALTRGEGPILALAPAANWVGKTWPPEQFAVLAAELLGRSGPMAGGRLMLLGGPAHRLRLPEARAPVRRQRFRADAPFGRGRRPDARPVRSFGRPALCALGPEGAGAARATRLRGPSHDRPRAEPRGLPYARPADRLGGARCGRPVPRDRDARPFGG
jgi:ADP-heptose:LPS heptosyltransferase